VHELIEELQQYHKEKSCHIFDLEKGVNSLTANDSPEKSTQTIQALLEPFQNKADVAHHHNEEIILSELRKTSAPIHRRVEDISADHEAFDTMIADISSKIVDQSVGCDELCSRIKRFVAVYNDHANGEENIFFPIADKYLQDSHWTRIKKAWK
jgi:hemerythrin-like domain-containing protein